MKENKIIISIMSIITLIQLFLPVALHLSFSSYYFFFIVIIARFIFSAKLYGIPINPYFAPVIEVSATILTLAFLLTSATNNSFPVYWFRLISVLILEASLLLGMFYEHSTFMYETEEI